MRTPLEELAWGTLDIEDLARGVCGKVTVEGVEKIHQAQRVFLSHHWKRDRRQEGWSRLEHRVYYRGNKKNRRWLKITVGNCLGIFGEFVVTRRP